MARAATARAERSAVLMGAGRAKSCSPLCWLAMITDEFVSGVVMNAYCVSEGTAGQGVLMRVLSARFLL